ncbi:winged helix-turn-helix domain-containing protein [Luteimonas arsenica]|uniref:winged helix-turn-helix domain-containing protein n=1 Tax=Luteimonas arsenica TaxID=1586242 RepID=UPI0010558F11|nr:winged helix-turn-helix domain-containing protein [Luteimonas arsenica]
MLPTLPANDPGPTGFRFGAFELDLGRRELRRDGVQVEMPVRVFECLECLLLNRDRAVGRDELLQAVFNRTDVSDGQLAQVILRARRCVDDDGQAQHSIRTVPRFGFRWAAPTVAWTPTAPAAAGGDAADAGAGAAEAGGPPSPAPAAQKPAPAAESAPVAEPAAVAAASPDQRRSRWLLLAAGTVLLAVAGLAWWSWRPAPEVPEAAAGLAGVVADPAATLVLPLSIGDGDDIAWARLGLMDYVAERLRAAGLSVPPSESTLALLGTASGDEGTGQLRRAVPGATVVGGQVEPLSGGGWRLRLQAVAADGLRLQAEAEAGDLLTAAAGACDRLLAALGRTAPAGPDGAALALEERLQRVRAAFLANELDTARRILEAAPPAQLSQPQLRFRLAQVDYRAGAIDDAERAFDALLGDPEAAGDPLFRARLLAYRGGARIRRNALHEAAADYDRALAALAERPADEGDLEHGAVLMGRAVALAALGRDDEATADFGAARSRLQRAGDRLGVARVDANLGALELGRGRPAQALDYLGSALAVFEGSTAMNELQVTRSAQSAAQLLRLDAAAALAASDEVQKLLPKTPDPALRLAAALDRANALIALGRLSEARRLLESPDIAARSTPPYEHRRAETLVELAWRSGEPAAAVAIADAVLADWTRLPGDTLRDRVRLRRAQAAAAADLPPPTGTRIDTAQGPTPDLLLAAAVELGDVDAAGPLLAEALALAEARGAPAGIVEVASVQVPWLLRQGRVREAEALAGRVAPWLDRCHDCAVLQLRLALALDDPAMADEARAAVRRLAGERRPPPLPSGEAAVIVP